MRYKQKQSTVFQNCIFLRILILAVFFGLILISFLKSSCRADSAEMIEIIHPQNEIWLSHEDNLKIIIKAPPRKKLSVYLEPFDCSIDLFEGEYGYYTAILDLNSIAELHPAAKNQTDSMGTQVTLYIDCQNKTIQRIKSPCKIILLNKTLTGKSIDNSHVVRSGPGSEFDRVAELPEGVKIPITGKYGQWLKIKLGNEYFWISLDSTKIEPGGTIPDEILLKQIKCTSQKNYSTAEFALSKPCAFSLNDTTSPPGLIISFYNASSSISEIIYDLKDELIKDIEFIENSGNHIKLKINLKAGKIWGYEGNFIENKFTLKIKKPLEPGKDNLKNIKVILDPGHGGSDSGAVGPAGLMEKEANLKISLELKKLLEEAGINVVLTRDTDKDLTSADSSAYEELKARVDVGKNNEGTIFISIHNNAMPDPKDGLKAKGTYTFFYRLQSMELAKYITAELAQGLNEEKAAHIFRSFHVIRQTYSPAVLVEVTFISNPDEEKKLMNQNYIKNIASAIYKGILKFLDN